jgi:hypothetical protein
MNSSGAYEMPAMSADEQPFNSQMFFEGPNSSPAGGSNHPSKFDY